MPNISGYWTLDGVDLGVGYKTIILDGTTDFLKYAPRKDSTEYNWPDQHGLDVDLSTPKFASRTIKLRCAILTDDRADFFDNYNALIAQLMLPGFHSIAVAAHDKSYTTLEYRDCSIWQKIDGLTLEGDKFTAYVFTLTLRENEPNPSAATLRLIDETGRYLTT